MMLMNKYHKYKEWCCDILLEIRRQRRHRKPLIEYIIINVNMFKSFEMLLMQP